MRALQFSEFGQVSNLRLIELPDPKADQTTAIVKVAAGSITPSDVKNVEGKMEGTILNGSHAELIAVPVASLRRKPRTLSLEQAAAVGVTYLAAWLGLVEYGQVGSSETLLVIGANGRVANAVAQIGKWKGARVIGTDIGPLAQATSARTFDEFFVPADRPLEIGVRELTKGRGADVVFDAVGA
jgi:NADPH:quinone reductase